MKPEIIISMLSLLYIWNFRFYNEIFENLITEYHATVVDKQFVRHTNKKTKKNGKWFNLSTKTTLWYKYIIIILIILSRQIR